MARSRRSKRGAVANDTIIGVAVSYVLLAGMCHHAIYAAGDLARDGATVTGFIGVQVTAVIGALVAAGKWVIDYSSVFNPDRPLVRHEIRNLLGLGALAIGSVLVHTGWAGVEVSRAAETVPSFFGSTITLALGALTQYGAWVLEFSKPSKGRTPPPMA